MARPLLLVGFAASFLLLCHVPASLASQPGAPIDAAIIEDCQYRDDAVARAAWEPMASSAPVSVLTLDGRKALRLPCRFAGTKIERASWDRKVKLDLGSCQGIQFNLLCRDASPVSYFSLYFQSGEGWYHATFFPESATGWNTVSIDKSALTTEGQPAGWSQITAIRLSAWRAKDVNTEFYLADLRCTGMLGGDVSVAILRDELTVRDGGQAANDARRYSESIAEQLRASAVGCAILSDSDVTAERLRHARLVILPYNPRLPDRVADALIGYAQAGGKLLVFYIIPERLRPVLSVKTSGHVRAPRAGHFSAIRFAEAALPGAPRQVGQRSWSITDTKPASSGSRILAEWLDDHGQTTGYAAVLGSSNSLVMTHVLLSDDPQNQRRMLLAMAGYLVPDLWRQAAETSLSRIGLIAGFESFDQARAQIAQTGHDNPRVESALASAGESRTAALKALTERAYPGTLDQAATSRQRLTEAYCLAQPSAPGEFRAFWCHSAFGVEGLDWDAAIRRLAENGFTAILPNMLWGGAAFYESTILPVAAPVAQRGDQIAQCLAACRKYGLQIHVWKVNWNLGRAAPKEFVERMRQEGRLQASSRGKEEPWLCPSDPRNRKLEIESMVEVVRRYGVDGIHFDYIRYPDDEHCFCAGCRQRFRRATGVAAGNWPQDALPGGPSRQAWLDWRRDNITAVVKAVSERARALRPQIKVSAAVFPNWSTDRDGIGQDWKLWCERGYLDFVCPMDYTPSNRRFENMVQQQVPWAGQVPCYPGIGVSASTSRFGVDRVIEQINITRRHSTEGFIIFNYGVPESQELLPLLGLGITAKHAVTGQGPRTPPRTGLVYDPFYLKHDTGAGHPERAERLVAIRERLERKGLLPQLALIKPRVASGESLATVHSPQYIEHVRQTCRAGTGYVDSPDTPASPDSYAVALLAVGGVQSAIDAVMEGRINNAFCAVRPPGHHALKDRAMGFCLFNNVAIAARYLQNQHRLSKVLVVDWDVHHGNGTQAIFYDDPAVFYFSTHQSPFYPGTGGADETGEGEGSGFTLNVPLPAGSGDAEYIKAFEERLKPAAAAFRPDFVLISAGFDAAQEDLLGRMNLTPGGYAQLTHLVKAIAQQHCRGRLVSVLEGGYNLEALAASVEAHLHALSE